MIKFIPNIITVFRILLVPFFIYFLMNDFINSKLYAAMIFGIASISDMLDGKIARKYGIVTRFGTFMDPLADKILIVSAFLAFVILGYIPLWMLLVIVFRDVIITLLRMLMEHNGITMVTSNIGKLKTVVQILSINLILFYMITLSYEINEIVNLFDKFSIIYFFMIITTIFTLITGIDYFYKNEKNLVILVFEKIHNN